MSEWMQYDNPIECIIRRQTQGHFDDVTGQRVNGAEQTITFTGEIQPKAGARRAREAATRYESTHWLQCGPDSDIRVGETLEAGGSRYTVVHIANWGTHIEADLETVR